jgi:hypothetical protein
VRPAGAPGRRKAGRLMVELTAEQMAQLRKLLAAAYGASL